MNFKRAMRILMGAEVVVMILSIIQIFVNIASGEPFLWLVTTVLVLMTSINKSRTMINQQSYIKHLQNAIIETVKQKEKNH